MTSRLQKIQIDGYTSIVSASVSLGSVNVLVGANGAGKSNFIQAFELLGRIVNEELGLFVGLNGGASALVNASADGPGIRLYLDGPPNSYEAVLVPAANDELVFLTETVYFHDSARYDRPYNRTIGKGHRETRLRETAIERQSIATYVLDLLDGCRVFHFHDTSADAPVKQFTSTADNHTLRKDAGNLAAVLLALRDSADRAEQGAYRRIVGAVRQVAPFFRDFLLQPENHDRIRLRWQESGSDVVFSANQMSDGTLRFACLATLLLHPRRPALVVLDEPELGLHPYAIVQLAGLLRQAAVESQVLIATQSVTLMNQFHVPELIVVERSAGNTVFSRPDAEQLEHWMKDFSLGDLWEKNLIGGRPGDQGGSRDG